MSFEQGSAKIQEDSYRTAEAESFYPANGNLKLAVWSSLLILLLTVLSALIGILSPGTYYPTAVLKENSLPNDIVTLLLGAPVLLTSIILTWRGSLVGLLVLPGAIFYGLYNYTAYLLFMPLNALYPFYLIIVTLSIYTVISLVASIDAPALKELIDRSIPNRLSGGILLFLGLAFMLRGLGVIVASLSASSTATDVETGVAAVDVIFSAAWVIGGFLLWRRQALGYVAGLGLLTQGSMLFIGVILVLILQPIVMEVEFALFDIVFVALMGLVFFIPFGLFLRGVLRS